VLPIPIAVFYGKALDATQVHKYLTHSRLGIERLCLGVAYCARYVPGQVEDISRQQPKFRNQDGIFWYARHVSILNTMLIMSLGACLAMSEELACFPSIGSAPETLLRKALEQLTFSAGDTNFVKQLIDSALTLQSKVFICLFVGAGGFFVSAIVLLVVLKRDLKRKNGGIDRKSTIMKTFMIIMLSLSTALALASAVATTEATGALQFASTINADSSVMMDPGLPLQVLQWLAFALSVLFTIGVLATLKSQGGISQVTADIDMDNNVDSFKWSDSSVEDSNY
jgi:hypothetical protein